MTEIRTINGVTIDFIMLLKRGLRFAVREDKLVREKRGMLHAEFQKSYNLIFSAIYYPIFLQIAPLDSEQWLVFLRIF